MITVTERAIKKINQQIERRGKGVGIRIGVKTTGCSGLAYILEFVDDSNQYDKKFNLGKYSLFVDKKSYQYLDGLTVDYEKQGLNEGFKFVNPNEKARCGCGISFTV
jgi:iron-sulfur cluster assembly protein